MLRIEGDMWENGNDIEDPSLWRAWSEQPQLQATSRYNAVVKFNASYIVPGHGPMFKITERHVELLKSQANSTYFSAS